MIGLYSKQSIYTGFPQYYDKTDKVWVKIDGKWFLDMSSFSVGCNILGYNNKRVNKAVIKAVKEGNNSSLVAKDEKKLEEIMLSDNSGYDYIRYTRTGGEALQLALMLTGKVNIITCGYHGWHIKNKNYLNVQYNQSLSFVRPDVFIMEAIRNTSPNYEWLNQILDWQSDGTIIIMDEVTSGYRFQYGGYHKNICINPDIVVYGKGISNGYPISVLLAKSNKIKDIFVSSTYFTDRLSCAAAIETLKQLKKRDYSYLHNLGRAVKSIYRKAQAMTEIKLQFNETLPIVEVTFPDIKIKAEFTRQMLKRGILHNGLFYATFAHTPDNIIQLEKAIIESMVYCKENLEKIQKQDYNMQERPVIVR